MYSKLKSFQNKVLKIGTAITKLDFEEESVRNLMETPNKICSSHSLLLKRIVLNVKEYKTYLPQGLVMNEEEQEAASQSEKARSSSARIGSKNTLNEGRSETSSISSHNDSGSRTSTENKSVDSMELEKSKQAKIRNKLKQKRKAKHQILMRNNLINYSLQERYGTLVLFDVNGWNDIIEKSSVELFVSYYTRYIEIVCEELKKRRGVVISLMNDKIVAGWNIKNIVVNHEIEATVCAMDILRRLKNDIRLPLRTPVKVSIITGNVIVGNMGCQYIKSFNFFGRKVNSLYAVNKYARTDGGFCVLVDARTREKIKFGFKTLFLNVVKCKERKFKVYKIMDRCKKERENEWLYELKDQLKEDDDDDFGSNDLYFLGEKLEEEFCSGEYEKAGECLTQIYAQVKMKLFQDLRENIKLRKPYTVIV